MDVYIKDMETSKNSIDWCECFCVCTTQHKEDKGERLMKYAIVTKFGVEIIEAEDMYEALLLLPWGEGYEPLAIVKAEENE